MRLREIRVIDHNEQSVDPQQITNPNRRTSSLHDIDVGVDDHRRRRRLSRRRSPCVEERLYEKSWSGRMIQLAFQQVDVFTSQPFLGNPLAVVVRADVLTDAQMAAFANSTNLSETTFHLQPTVSALAHGEVCRPFLAGPIFRKRISHQRYPDQGSSRVSKAA
jgi:hypothetical protein